MFFLHNARAVLYCTSFISPQRQTLTGPLTDLDQSLALTERALFHHHDIRLDKCKGESRLLAEGHVPRAMPAATMDR